MPARVDDFNKKFVYTDTNPEGIISAKKGAFFYRRNNDFYLNRDGNLEVGFWEKLPYKTVIIPPPPASKLIKYKKPHEIWLKTTNGFYNDQQVLMPKTGWKLYSYEDAFALQVFRNLKWLFPPPVSSYDPKGGVGSRSYDLNYFYAKIDGIWYRTPITTWYGTDNIGVPDDPNLTTYLPYVDMPRSPVGVDWTVDVHCAIPGDQSYDNSFFYIKVDNTTWRRARLNIYADAYKMALF